MLKEELKKIWKPATLLILVVYLLADWQLGSLEFYINNGVKNGEPNTTITKIQSDLVKQYGTQFNDEMVDELHRLEKDAIEQLDVIIAENPTAKSLGLLNYTQYEEVWYATIHADSESETEESRKLREQCEQIWTDISCEADGRTPSYGSPFWVNEACKSILEKYDDQLEYGFDHCMSSEYIEEDLTGLDQKNALAAKKLLDNETAWRNVFPETAVEGTSGFFAQLSALFTVAVCILLAPVLVQDKMSRMHALQWSSHTGRRLPMIQFAASMLSAGVLAVAVLVGYGAIFAKNDLGAFLPCRLYSFTNIMPTLFNPTFGVWVLLLIVEYFLFAMAISALVFVLSWYSANYVSMIFKLLILAFTAKKLAAWLMQNYLCFGNVIFKVFPIPASEVIALILLAVVCAVASFWMLSRVKKQDLLLG